MSIRLRVAVVFALALAIAFTLGGWLFHSQLSAAMLRSTDAALAARLSQAARYSEDDGGPALTPGTLAPGEYIVQIVGPSGQVKHSSAGTRPLLTAAELNQARHGEVKLTRTLEGEPERVLAGPFGEGRGPSTAK